MAKKHYRLVKGLQIIRIDVDSANELVDSKDPAPFKGQILDDDFLDYIESLSDETSHRTPLKIDIFIKESEPQTSATILSQALKEHFEYKIEKKKGEIRKYFRTARIFLIGGLFILSFCLLIAHLLSKDVDSFALSTLREGFIIFGWVSMWRPLEILLFDWYPHYDRIRYFRKIAQAEVAVQYL